MSYSFELEVVLRNTMNPMKRGGTLRIPFQVLDGLREPQSLTGFSLQSTIRKVNGDHLKDLTVSITDSDLGMCEILATPTETENWPVGHLVLDLQISDSAGNAFFTEDLNLPIKEAQTRG